MQVNRRESTREVLEGPPVEVLPQRVTQVAVRAMTRCSRTETALLVRGEDDRSLQRVLMTIPNVGPAGRSIATRPTEARSR